MFGSGPRELVSRFECQREIRWGQIGRFHRRRRRSCYGIVRILLITPFLPGAASGLEDNECILSWCVYLRINGASFYVVLYPVEEELLPQKFKEVSLHAFGYVGLEI